MEVKIFECARCKELSKKMKGQERFTGTRKQVRKHLVSVHRVMGRKNSGRLNKKDFGQSNISKNTIEYK